MAAFTPASSVTTDAMFERAQKEHQLYKNIKWACLCMLDELVADQLKVSNIPALIGWNTSILIRDILDQLDGTYRKLDTMMLLSNDMLFCSLFNPADAPKSLFYRVEQS
jgi:hypothetical protein